MDHLPADCPHPVVVRRRDLQVLPDLAVGDFADAVLVDYAAAHDIQCHAVTVSVHAQHAGAHDEILLCRLLALQLGGEFL